MTTRSRQNPFPTIRYHDGEKWIDTCAYGHGADERGRLLVLIYIPREGGLGVNRLVHYCARHNAAFEEECPLCRK